MKKTKSEFFLWALAGSAVACLTAVAISAFTIYPELQEIFPQNLWPVCAFFGGPGLIAGFLVKRFSKHRLSSVAGFIGIILGVLWHLHLSELSAQIANAHYDSASEILASVTRVGGFFLTRWIVNIEYKVLLFEGVLGVAIGLTMLLSPVFISILGVYSANNITKKSCCKLISAAVFISLAFVSSSAFADEQDIEGDFYSAKYILILKSTKDYNEAVNFALDAGKKLKSKFNNDNKRYSKEKGIYFEGIEDDDYNGGYYPRRYAGENITLENSGYYEGFDEGYIIVVGGVYDDKESSTKALRNAQTIYNGAYVKKTKMWMGCIH